MLRGIGQHVGFGAAFEQVVRRLNGDDRRNAAKPLDLGRTDVAQPDRADLTRLVQALERGRGALQLGARIRPVQLIEVDGVGAQPAQRRLDLGADAPRRGVSEHLAVAPCQADLGGDHDAVAQTTARQRLADDLLGATETVDRRGVDQRDALVERGLDRAHGIALVGAAPHPSADRPRAEADTRNLG